MPNINSVLARERSALVNHLLNKSNIDGNTALSPTPSIKRMPINQSHELEGAYERQGLDVDFIVVHEAGHGGDEFYAQAHLQRLIEFLDSELRPKRRRSGT